MIGEVRLLFQRSDILNDGLKCEKAYFEKLYTDNIVKCKIDNQLCGYQFFCPKFDSYINSDGCITCKNYIERKEI